jgi:hypothetical protein
VDSDQNQPRLLIAPAASPVMSGHSSPTENEQLRLQAPRPDAFGLSPQE